MATTGLMNGTLVSLYKDVSGTLTKFANGTSADFSITKDTIDATNKDGGAYKEFLVGLTAWTMNFEGIYEEDGSVATGQSAKEILTELVAGAFITVAMTTSVTGDMKLSGSALLTNFAWNAPVNDVSTFTCSLQGSGTLTIAVIP
jgi:predicted secreted protein